MAKASLIFVNECKQKECIQLIKFFDSEEKMLFNKTGFEVASKVCTAWYMYFDRFKKVLKNCNKFISIKITNYDFYSL